jgi:acetylornithine/succinyldiaminopimelate/putrescine aminotransferase
VSDVRGGGLLVGADLEIPAAEVAAAALERGLVVLTAGEHVLRLAPPLVVGADEIDHALTVLEEVLG